MLQYEYKEAKYPGMRFLEGLNKDGEDGWELVDSQDQGYWKICLLKRRKENNTLTNTLAKPG